MATDTASAAITYEQVVTAWNAKADEYNQWSELGEDEKIEWAVACAKAAPAAQGDAEDAARYRWLIASCESDGLGYWLPEICLKEGDLFPSKVEADTVIDAARKQGANHD